MYLKYVICVINVCRSVLGIVIICNILCNIHVIFCNILGPNSEVFSKSSIIFFDPSGLSSFRDYIIGKIIYFIYIMYIIYIY